METREGTKYIDAEGVEPITKFPEYIPPRKGKKKVTKDLDSEKFFIHTPQLPKNITFKGPHLAHVPLLKMEDCDLANHERFPHLRIENYMRWVY